MRTRFPSLLLAVTIGLAGLLSACGDDDSNKSSDEETTSQSTPSEETSEGTGGETTEETPEESTDPDAGEAEGDKPARDDVIAGYSKIVKDQGQQTGMDMPDDIVNKVVTCFVDEVYDEASAQTLQALADSEPTGIDTADTKLFTDAQTTCTKAIS